MNIFTHFAIVFATTLSLTAADGAVTFVNHDKVSAALKEGGPLVTAPDLLVSGSHRDKAGQVEDSKVFSGTATVPRDGRYREVAGA